MRSSHTFRKRIFWKLQGAAAGLALLLTAEAAPGAMPSHAPVRPLPAAAKLPAPQGRLLYADTRAKGKGSGTKQSPYASLADAVKRLEPGMTLLLRGGIYRERVVLALQGKANAPITIRAYPGELPILDGGAAEFLEDPAQAWEPVQGGATGEFRSRRDLPAGSSFGRFADSFLPLHGYIDHDDLRSESELWMDEVKHRRTDSKVGIYCGPGLWQDGKGGRVYIRLAATRLASLGERAYSGGNDPRRIPIILDAPGPVLNIKGSRHLRLQGLALRGGGPALHLEDSADIALDHLHLCGEPLALNIQNAERVHVLHTALRGSGAPWLSRAHHKYRSNAGYLVTASGNDLEFGWCEITDGHDGMLLEHANNVRLHHSLIEEFNDDGLEVGSKRPDQHLEFFQNRIARCLLSFSLHGAPNTQRAKGIKTDPGSGVFVFRNVMDMRGDSYGAPPECEGGDWMRRECNVAGDHASPVWPDFYVYHNLLLGTGRAWRNYYALGWARATVDATRRIHNNIVLQAKEVPGWELPPADHDFKAGHNLHFNLSAPGDEVAGKWPQLQKGFPEGDLFEDPDLPALKGETTGTSLLGSKSPALEAGMTLPESWPDPLRKRDAGRPDLGPVPAGCPVEGIGVDGRLPFIPEPMARPSGS